MKKLVFTMMLATAGIAMTNKAQAQVSVSINISNQPARAPEAYDDAAYYYMPDPDIYYDMPAHQFMYLSGSRWVRSASLPAAYRNYDLYKVHKVAINEKNAYLHHNRDKKRYASFRGKYDQQPIRDSRNDKYASDKTTGATTGLQRTIIRTEIAGTIGKEEIITGKSDSKGNKQIASSEAFVFYTYAHTNTVE